MKACKARGGRCKARGGGVGDGTPLKEGSLFKRSKGDYEALPHMTPLQKEKEIAPPQDTMIEATGPVNRLGRKRGGRVKKADGGSANWIKSAIKHPGIEGKAAKLAGMSTHEYMEKHKHDSGKAGARARLGLRLSAMAKHRS